MYDSVLETNIKGAFFCTQQAVKYMKQRRCGSVVNIGSTHWQTGGLGLSVYSVSKGGLHTFTQHISHHYAPDGIRCNWVTVGWVMSERRKKPAFEYRNDGRRYCSTGKKRNTYGTVSDC